jgi:hypothetical protein
MSEDLSALDGNALVARLAVVKQRLTKSWDTDRADTEAVLDECAVRLLGTEPLADPAFAAAKVAADEDAARLTRELASVGTHLHVWKDDAQEFPWRVGRSEEYGAIAAFLLEGDAREWCAHVLAHAMIAGLESAKQDKPMMPHRPGAEKP